jgi:hypothetical protein
VVRSSRCAFVASPPYALQLGRLFDDQTGARFRIARSGCRYTRQQRLNGPWLVFDCSSTQTPAPELYSPATRSWRSVASNSEFQGACRSALPSPLQSSRLRAQECASMKRVTRTMGCERARELLDRVPRACISFACDHGPQAQPVALIRQGDRYLAGVPSDAEHLPGAGQEIVLLVDEGIHFFDLRAISIRGHTERAEVPVGAPPNRTWFEVVPERIAAWDFGALRVVCDER